MAIHIALDEMGTPCLTMDFALKVTIPALVKSLLEMQHDISAPGSANVNQKATVTPRAGFARPQHQCQLSLQKIDFRIELDEVETPCLTMPFTVKLALPGLIEFLLELPTVAADAPSEEMIETPAALPTPSVARPPGRRNWRHLEGSSHGSQGTPTTASTQCVHSDANKSPGCTTGWASHKNNMAPLPDVPGYGREHGAEAVNHKLNKRRSRKEFWGNMSDRERTHYDLMNALNLETRRLGNLK